MTLRTVVRTDIAQLPGVWMVERSPLSFGRDWLVSVTGGLVPWTPPQSTIPGPEGNR